MRRFNTAFAALLGLFLYLVCSQVVWAADEKGILWRIDGAASQPSYLLGTIPSDDARVWRRTTSKAATGRLPSSPHGHPT